MAITAEEHKRYYTELNQHWWGLERRIGTGYAVAALVLAAFGFVFPDVPKHWFAFVLSGALFLSLCCALFCLIRLSLGKGSDIADEGHSHLISFEEASTNDEKNAAKDKFISTVNRLHLLCQERLLLVKAAYIFLAVTITLIVVLSVWHGVAILEGNDAVQLDSNAAQSVNL